MPRVLIVSLLLFLLVGCPHPAVQAQVQSPDIPYDRDLYRHWVDADGDCQDTRQEVLIAESLEPVEMDERGCRVVSGSWFDAFTGQTFTDPSSLDIDHMIPLAEAHRSGAAAWNAEQREAFANDLFNDDALIAVSASVNRSKSDRDPAEWLPPDPGYRCEYLQKWILVKAAWSLSMGPEETLAIRIGLLGCTPRPQPPTTQQPVVISAVETGIIKTGYVIVTLHSGTTAPITTITYGMVSNGAVWGKAGVLPTQLTTSAATLVEFVGPISRKMGVALVNPNSALNAITLSLKDANGLTIGSPFTVTLNPYSQTAKFVSEIFSTGTLETAFTGSMNMQSSLPFGPMGLGFTGTTFSTVLIGGTAGGTTVPQRTLGEVACLSLDCPLAGTIGGSSAQLFPQFAFGGGWASQIGLVNNSGATATGRIDIFGPDGSSIAIPLNGATKSTFNYAIPANGTVIFAPRDGNGQSPL